MYMKADLPRKSSWGIGEYQSQPNKTRINFENRNTSPHQKQNGKSKHQVYLKSISSKKSIKVLFKRPGIFLYPSRSGRPLASAAGGPCRNWYPQGWCGASISVKGRLLLARGVLGGCCQPAPPSNPATCAVLSGTPVGLGGSPAGTGRPCHR